MILVDTSVWIDHFQKGDAVLRELLTEARVLSHPFIVGELAMGNLRSRSLVLRSLQDLPEAVVAQDAEVLRYVSDQSLFGVGIGYLDAHLLASTQLTLGATLWTRDKRLARVAAKLSLAFRPV